ncbi:MAG: Flp/Fap pilin component [Humibacillus sp.]|nr:Flp/Fap pilin component [Humibacillus sp.]
MLQLTRILLNARLAKMEERGASAVEYGLLVAGIAAVIVAVVFTLGGQIKNAFDGTSTCIANKGCAPSAPSTSTGG